MIIKILLLIGIAAVGTYALRGRATSTHLAVRRLAGSLVLLLAACSVLFPEVVTWAANIVGVGRGTDLLLYVFIVVSLFVWVGLYRRILDLEARLTRLTRRTALDEAQNVPPPWQDPRLEGDSDGMADRGALG